MNLDDSRDTARRISELWPTANTSQIDATIDALMRPLYEREEVWAALDEMYYRDSKFFVFSELRARIDEMHPEKRREDGMTRAAREQLADDRKRSARVDEIDRTIGAMTDAEVMRLKGEVLAECSGWVRSSLEPRDPRKSAWLKGLIFERIAGE